MKFSAFPAEIWPEIVGFKCLRIMCLEALWIVSFSFLDFLGLKKDFWNRLQVKKIIEK